MSANRAHQPHHCPQEAEQLLLELSEDVDSSRLPHDQFPNNYGGNTTTSVPRRRPVALNAA